MEYYPFHATKIEHDKVVKTDPVNSRVYRTTGTTWMKRKHFIQRFENLDDPESCYYFGMFLNTAQVSVEINNTVMYLVCELDWPLKKMMDYCGLKIEICKFAYWQGMYSCRFRDTGLSERLMMWGVSQNRKYNEFEETPFPEHTLRGILDTGLIMDQQGKYTFYTLSPKIAWAVCDYTGGNLKGCMNYSDGKHVMANYKVTWESGAPPSDLHTCFHTYTSTLNFENNDK